MNKLVIIVLLILLLGGGGAIGWVVFKDQQATAGEESTAKSEDMPPVYIEFNTFQLPVLGEERVEQLVTFVLALEVADEKAGDKVLAMAPRLNDGFVQSLYGSLHSGTVMRGNGVVDIGVLKARIMSVSDQVLGEGVVQDALIQMVSQRPL